ncbi:hypothetical protein EfmJHP80_30370 (plasmid) [Enterococcus faecium]|nr:hypothetical protein EfmJHP80_30370 [Enterococcus faecium]
MIHQSVQKKDIMGDKTVRVRADLHHIIKIETAKNGGNVKEVMEIRLRSKLKSVLIVQYLKILCIIGIEVNNVDKTSTVLKQTKNSDYADK